MKKINKRDFIFASAAVAGMALAAPSAFAAVDLKVLNTAPAQGDMSMGPDAAKDRICIRHLPPLCSIL
jgi:hypothetical protein